MYGLVFIYRNSSAAIDVLVVLLSVVNDGKNPL